MIKLLTLENLSAFSSDAVYKICLSLERFGMTDESIFSYPTVEALFYAADTYLSAGDEVIVAAETNSFNSIKKDLLSYLSVETYSSPEIAQRIAMNAGTDESDFDIQSMCTVAEKGLIHLSDDGLYSGFSVNVLNGRLTIIPLDFSRLDGILESFVNGCLDPKPAVPETDTGADGEPVQENPYDFSEPVSKMIYSLMQLDRRLAIATGEATMWIYNLYDKIDGLSDVVNFVEVIDEEETEPQNEQEPAAETEEAAENTDLQNDPDTQPETEEAFDAESDFDFEEPEKAEEAQQTAEAEPREKESVSAKTIRFAREAMSNTDSDFGAAISDVYTSENEDGTTNYFAFVAVADKKGAKAKKINTVNYEDAELLLPHCITVLSETVCQKVDAVSASLSLEGEASTDGNNGEEKKLSKGMIAFAIAIFAIAIISPIIILSSIASGGRPKNNDTTTTTLEFNQVLLPTEQTTAAELYSTTADIFGTSAQGIQTGTSDPIFAPMEPTAADISVITTTPPVSSTKGTFTFYVFGYGHGVGLSQTGANALAAQGWSFAQILANYYYGATLVSGDTYPEKINYSGTDYSTRDYLAGALYGEMGDSFNNEALKAQAVAIYTFAKYYGYKVDSSGTAFKSGASSKIYSIVDDIIKNGFYIAFNGQTALTPFHATSAGKTTSYRNVWGSETNGVELTYLAGGRPSPNESQVENFKTTVTMTSDEFKSLVESKGLGISCSGDPATWISIISHDTAINENIGYVSTVNVGGKLMSGNEFRNKVMDGRLRSHCFTVVYTPSVS